MPEFDLAVIGAGAAGLSLASGAAQLGLKTVLFEKREMGGECLHTGCVPSKALLAAAKAVRAGRQGAALGIDYAPPAIDWQGVMAHQERVIAAIAPHDSQARFEGLGVTVVRAAARFTGPHSLEAEGQSYRARFIAIAAGSHPFVPEIEGLTRDDFLTNETVFTLAEKPQHLIVIGGGAEAVEMAQAHRLLGAEVTLLVRSRLLREYDEAPAAMLRDILRGNGVTICEGASVTRGMTRQGGGYEITFEQGGQVQRVTGSHLLAATGRRVDLSPLAPEAAGVAWDHQGVRVDARLRTSVKHIYAIGDCGPGPRLTHAAGYQAGIVLRNIAFKLPAKVDYGALPRAIYTDPELAQVGMTQDDAIKRYGAYRVKVTEIRHTENDRARADGQADGALWVVTRPNGRILGATIMGPQAGDQTGLWALAIAKGMKLKDIAGLILPYPSYAEAAKAAAGAFYKDRLFSPKTRRAVRSLQRIGRVFGV